MRRALLVVMATVGVLAGSAATAQADTGSITSVQSLAPGELAATFSASHECPPLQPCEWSAYAVAEPTSAPCSAHATVIVWSADGLTEPRAVRQRVRFEVLRRSVRLCLYVEVGDAATKIAELIYRPPACSDGKDNDRDGTRDRRDLGCLSLNDRSERLTRTPTLGKTEATRYLKIALRRRFKGSFTYADGPVYRCRRASRTSFRCRPAWVVGDGEFFGTARIWLTRRGEIVDWNYAWRITILDGYCADLKRQGVPGYRHRKCSRVNRVD